MVIVMNRIQAIAQVATGQEYGNNGVNYLDSGTLKQVTENVLILLDGVEVYFSDPLRVCLIRICSTGIGNEFLKTVGLFLDDINARGCHLIEGKNPNSLKEIMPVLNSGNESRLQLINKTFLNQLEQFEYLQGEKTRKCMNRASPRHERLNKKIFAYFFREVKTMQMVKKAMIRTIFLERGA